MKQSPKITLLALVGLFMVIGSAAQTTQKQSSPEQKLKEYLKSLSVGEPLGSSVYGIFALKENGDTVAYCNGSQRMLPASCMKLITTGAALHQLGPGFKYTTKIGYSGSIKDGVLDGNLYIVGGGDPTIASKDSIAIPRYFLFSQWKSFLDKAGIKQINGYVIGDGRYFDGAIEKDTWSYQDIGTAYGAGGDGLCFYENAQDFNVSPGAVVGAPVNVTVAFPSTPWITYTYNAKTSKAGLSDELYLFNSDMSPYAEIRGSYPISRKGGTEEFSNKFGAYTCASYFRNYLESNGVKVNKGPADIRLGRIRFDLSSFEYGPYASKVDDLKILGETKSPSLKSIVRETLYKSDNFYAETLLRTLGRTMHHSASYDSSYVAIKEVLAKIGAESSKVQIYDGSGLARHNYISPEYFVKFLGAMMESPVFSEYVGSLASPGGPHYASRLAGQKTDLKSRIHYKSGSMNGVRCFCGYIEPSEGTKDEVIMFSVMTNNSLAKSDKIDKVIDTIICLMADCN